MTIEDQMKKALKAVRKHKRRAVKLDALLDLDGQQFECIAYDVSLGGVRIKSDAPVSENENVAIRLDDNLKHMAKVIWISEGFVGLTFNDSPQEIREQLNGLAANLN